MRSGLFLRDKRLVEVVVSFTLDHPQFGGWGATLVQLRSNGTQQT